jgi:hypothetical protein
MAEAKKPASKKIVDVEQPNTTAPSSTSKPVLVTNRPIIQDPMVKESPDEGTTIKVTTGSTKIKLQPLTEPVVKPVDDPSKTTEVSTAPESEKKPESPTPPPASKETTPPPPAPATAAAAPQEAEKPAQAEREAATENPTGEEDKSSGDQAAEVANQEAAAEAEQTKHDESLQKLIDGKQYFLPINSVEKRRTKRFVMLGVVLALLLAVTWVDVALDAGLVQLGRLKPVTHFFSN